MLKFAPMVALVVMMSACGQSGGTADSRDIGDAVLAKIQAKDFDTLVSLMDQSETDLPAQMKVRDWKVENKYDTWKQYKARLEGDNGMDPKSKSGIDGEDAWKSMDFGKHLALSLGLYRLHAIEDLDKRLEGPWALEGKRDKLEIEGQGSSTLSYGNGYGDTITVRCERKGGLWYLANVSTEFEKDTPKPPKED
jgi:hypothetical protein